MCAQCREDHRTSTCTITDDERACANCKAANLDHRGHGAADHVCPFFKDKLYYSLDHNLDTPYPYFLMSEDPSSWVTNEESGEAYVPNASAPARKAALQRDMGPKPVRGAARGNDVSRGRATAGRQHGTLQGAEEGHWGATQTTLDAHWVPQQPPDGRPSQGREAAAVHGSQAPGPWTHPDRAALITALSVDDDEGNTGEPLGSPTKEPTSAGARVRERSRIQAAVKRAQAGPEAFRFSDDPAPGESTPAGDARAPALPLPKLHPIKEEDEVELLIEGTLSLATVFPPERVADSNV
jgi:hypothetical protein